MNAKTHDAQNIKKLQMAIINFSFALSSNRTWKGTLNWCSLTAEGRGQGDRCDTLL